MIYAFTGKANTSGYSFTGNGSYKLTDLGQTWIHTGLEYNAYTGRIQSDHSDSQIVVVPAYGTQLTPDEQRGIYHSLNSSNSWVLV